MTPVGASGLHLTDIAYTPVVKSDGDTSGALSSAKLKRKRSTTAVCHTGKAGRTPTDVAYAEPTLDTEHTTALVEHSSPSISCSQRRARLRIDIPLESELAPEDTEYDGLFTPLSSAGSVRSQTMALLSSGSPTHSRATKAPPPIPGLYLFTPPHEGDDEDGASAGPEKSPAWPITHALEESLLQTLTTSYFHSGEDQAMLFGTSSKGFPPALGDLLRVVRVILETCVHEASGRTPADALLQLPTSRSDLESSPPKNTPTLREHQMQSFTPSENRPNPRAEILDLIFPAHEHLKRQAIINFYLPGEGITPHVDLLGRYADGIVGVSLGSGCVMTFAEVVAANPTPEDSQLGDAQPSKETPPRRYDVYLPRRSVIVLSGPARYDWAHSIEEQAEDWVDGELIARRERLSVTFRWMLEGADVVGCEM